jgi:hypothetical protein
MKHLLGILIVVNAGLLLWGMSQEGVAPGSTAQGRSINPELIDVLPPVLAKPSKTALINPAEGPAVTTSEPESVAIVSALDDEAADEPAADEPFCLMLGPYDSDDERVRVSRQLDQMTIAFKSQDIPRGRVTGYRVFQGPFADDREVRKARDALGRKGITDLFLLREEKNQYISLGFFSSQQGADNFVKNLASRGVKVKQRVDYATTYWLVIDNAEAAARLKKSRFPGYPQNPVKVPGGCA